MFERDYILRAIKLFMQSLARIMREKKAQRYEAALSEIAAAGQALVGMNTEQLAALPLAGIVELVKRDGVVDVQLGAAAARLLKEHGEIVELQGGKAKRFYVKAFVLYDELSQMGSDETLDAQRHTMDWLMDRLD